jgi:hypothetical protein
LELLHELRKRDPSDVASTNQLANDVKATAAAAIPAATAAEAIDRLPGPYHTGLLSPEVDHGRIGARWGGRGEASSLG